MRIFTLLTGLFFFGTSLFAQNLVPNPSFESVSSIPSNWGQIGLATPWYSANGSCDLLHTSASIPSIPSNFFGTQNTHSGNAYASIAVSSTNTYHEYIGIALSTPLTVGQAYYCEAYVSAGEGGYRYGADGFGFKFTTGAVMGSAGNPPISGPTLVWPTVISDITNWVQVSWTFTPTVSSTNLTIGHFASTSAMNWQLIGSSGSINSLALFIDDVVVQPATVFAIGANKIAAQQIGSGKANISWDLDSVDDLKEFGLMRSSNNGASWQYIANIPASNGVLKYNYLDVAKIYGMPLTYRLRQVTQNGSVSYSDNAVVTFDYPSLEESLTIAPNPVAQGTDVNVQFVLEDEANVDWQIFNLHGVRVAEGSEGFMSGSSNLLISIADFAKGHYFLKLFNGKESVVRRLTVN